MATQNRFPRKERFALDNFAFRFSTPVKDVAGKFSTLTWTTVGNNFAIRVYTNNPNDTDSSGYIQMAFEGPNFYVFIDLLKKVVESQGEVKYHMTYSNFTFSHGKRSEDRVAQTSLYVGKNSEGVIWISVIDLIKKDRPRIQFPITTDRNYVYSYNGEPISKADGSVLMTKALIKSLEELGSLTVFSTYKEPQPRANNQNQQQQQNNTDSSFDDDLPF